MDLSEITSDQIRVYKSAFNKYSYALIRMYFLQLLKINCHHYEQI